MVVVSDGIASYDAEHDRVTRRYLEGAIARFVPSEGIAEILQGGAGAG